MSDKNKLKTTPKTFIPGRTRVLTGIKPTGMLHLGNYASALKTIIEYSHKPEYEIVLMCVDWHGLTDRKNIFEPKNRTLQTLATYLAMDYNLENNILILQSDFPQIQEISWYLGCVTGTGLLERSHAYKDALANGKEATVGLFYYPILMAADILTFDSQLIPVGKDQLQHLEMSSDMLKHFNHATGTEVFYDAKPLVKDDTAIILGIDGRKMSKSYNNEIAIFAPRKDVEKKVKEIVTDSAGLNDTKDPDKCTIFQIFKSFASPEAISHMENKLRTGTGYGYGHAKQEFMQEFDRIFGQRREKFEYYCNNPKEVFAKMQPGYATAEKYANTVKNRAREALGLLSAKR